MGRKKKAAKRVGPTADRAVGTSMRALLRDVDLVEPESPPPTTERRRKKATPKRPEARPSESLRGDDRIAFHDAMAGVRPLDRARPVRAPHIVMEKTEAPAARASADDEARGRLAALVAGGVRFEIEREDEFVFGRRAGIPAAQARALSRRGILAEAELDLHGRSGDEAAREVVRFVRAQHRRGARQVCIIHGKGLHSAGGISVLGDRVVEALTRGGAAPVVQAFATAPVERGGAGALMIRLQR